MTKNTIQDFLDVISGDCDNQTRERIAAELTNPNSDISFFLDGLRDESKSLLGMALRRGAKEQDGEAAQHE